MLNERIMFSQFRKLNTISWNNHRWWSHAHAWNQPKVPVDRWRGCSLFIHNIHC